VEERRKSACSPRSPTLPRGSIHARSTSASSKAWQRAGAFDTLDANRARVFGGADAILAACQRTHEAATIGQNDMFGGAADAPSIMLPQIEPWLPAERLRREYDAIGFFLSGHPLDDYATVLKRLRVQSWAEFSRAVKTGATAGKVAATVVSRMERRTKTATRWHHGPVGSDRHFEAVLFSRARAISRRAERARPFCCSSAPSCRAKTCGRGCCTPSRWMPPPPKPKKACASSSAIPSRWIRSPSD